MLKDIIYCIWVIVVFINVLIIKCVFDFLIYNWYLWDMEYFVNYGFKFRFWFYSLIRFTDVILSFEVMYFILVLVIL